MKPSQRMHGLVQHINAVAQQLGLDMLTVKKEYIFRTWVTISAPLTYAVFGVYWGFLEARRHWLEGIKSSIMLGGLVSGSAKLLTILLRHTPIRDLLHFIIKICEDYEQRGVDFIHALNFGIDRVYKIQRIIFVGYSITFLIMLLMPLVLLFYKGIRITVMPYEIPGLSIDSNIGYGLTYLQHTIPEVVGGIGFYLGDMLVLLALNQIQTFADIFQLKATALNDALERKEQSRYVCSVGEYKDFNIQALLMDLINWHQLFVDYCELVEKIYDNLIAAQVFAASVSIVICLCVNLNEFDLISAIFFLVSAYSMSVYCIVGTQIEFAYDQVYQTVSCLSWHELSCEQRKLYMMMLQRAQNMKIIVLLGITPLSLGTALQASELDFCFGNLLAKNNI
uniref:Odorant receptor n=1 Tax=Drosophila mojavensis TaxID=7230 RepID=A0A386IR91_DROMO|nr:odorant receptor 83c1 [Drosophila mojavensis]AYD60367.1 odorant receptor 83c1 [Drosophila mojavensis]AYD60370.1 odorant receptor 83c1 [Drosophila mojavensis]